MKNFLSISILLLVLLGIVLYQSPALRHKISSILPDSLNQQLNHIYPNAFLNKTKPLYKWKNKQGQWIVSDEPPKDHTPYETMQYNRDTNIIPSKEDKGKH